MNNSNSADEAGIICSYLLDLKVNSEIREKYTRIIKNRYGDQIKSKRLIFALKHPWSIGMLDGATALIDPASELRSRVYIMFAILETTPDYSNSFLPQERSLLYGIALLSSGVGAVLKTVGGLILIKIAGLDT